MCKSLNLIQSAAFDNIGTSFKLEIYRKNRDSLLHNNECSVPSLQFCVYVQFQVPSKKHLKSRPSGRDALFSGFRIQCIHKFLKNHPPKAPQLEGQGFGCFLPKLSA